MFSSEFFFEYLAGKTFDQIRRFIDAHFSEAHVLLFIRDPVVHASSCYLQETKVGYTKPIEFYFGRYRVPQHVNTVLDNLETMPQVALTVKNYTSTQDVVSVVETWLGFEPHTLARPPVNVVNRSLTRAEFEFCRQLNEHYGSTYYPFAWELCNALPDLKSDPLYPPLPAQERMWERLADEIERVNSRVNAGERYRRDRDLHAPSSSDKELYHISREQLGVIARIASHEIKGRTASEADNENLRRDIDLIKQQVAQIEARALLAEERLSHVFRSTSWRATEPLRALKSLADRLLGRAR